MDTLPTFIPRKPIRYRARATPEQASPPATVTILSITATGGAETIVAFSGPVTVDDTASPGNALEIEGGNEVVSVAQLDANRVTVDFVEDVTAGQEWQLSAQPAWLLTPVAGPLPVSGFVAA